MLSALLAVSNASLTSGSPMYLTSQPYQTVNEWRKPTLWWSRWHLPQTINKTPGSTDKLKSPLIVIPIVNRSMVHFCTYSLGKKWSYPSSTDQRSISCSYISQAMVASSVSTNQRSIFTHIVPEKSGHTHRQHINGPFSHI